GHRPEIHIESPADGAAVVGAAGPITLTASADDVEDGDLGEHIVWTSSLDGPLGTGATLHAEDLHVGTHVVTATIPHPYGATEHTQVTVRVRPVNQAPTIVIASPTDDAEVEPGEELHLSAGVSDDFDEDLAEHLHWISDLDGPLPGGGNPTAHLSAGTHEL